VNVPYKKMRGTCIYVLDDASEPCDELLHELGRHARLLHMLRARMTTRLPEGLDGSAFSVLMTLAKFGPRRQGELAEAALLDPSTVSRYVAQLVRAGLAERRPDPGDGRAVQLAASASGMVLAREAMADRKTMIQDLVADWSEQDTQDLIRLLRRLNDVIEVRRDTAGSLAPPRLTGS
jgi:DNA-binding MarR family transcriptional regulator